LTALRWGSATDVGMVREINQDSVLAADPLFAVADGMGGHQGGEVASATALEVLQQTFTSEHNADGLREAIRRANAKVWDKAQLDENLHGMGTTLTALALVKDEDSNADRLAIVHVGDSRAYLFRDGQLQQVTEDHSLVEEMVRTGQISAEEAETHPRRNIVTRALGVEPTVEADFSLVEPQIGDRVLLCSDGLVREVTDDQVAAVLRRLKSPDEAVRELVSMAKEHGGHDNITVVVVDIEEDAQPAPPQINLPSKADKKVKTPKAKKPKDDDPRVKFSFRAFLFCTAILALIVIACGSVVWYARSSYFVGLEGQQIVIYRGRTDNVLWFKPTVAERTNILAGQVLPSRLPDLQKGETESSLSAAHSYIVHLTQEAQEAAAAAAPTTTTTTAPPATSTTNAKQRAAKP
jgi:PPM family protein phosphatase